MTGIAKFRPVPSTKYFPAGLLNDFFNRAIDDVVGSDALISQPAVNIKETVDGFTIELAAPGFEKNNFGLKVEDDVLIVSAKREANPEDQNERFTRREFRFDTFERSFKLPETVNQEAINAVYKNGVLQVTLPKKEEVKPSTKTIQIG